MRLKSIYFIAIAAGLVLFSACAKYKDSKAVTDPRLTNPYCNDPNAVNYNWGFPGKPDSTVCIYPTDLFKGVFVFHDSIAFSSGLFIYADTLMLTIHKLSNNKLSVLGLCPSGDSLLLTANIFFTATVDTTEVDSTASWGQKFCSLGDTVNGTITRDRINDSLLYLSLQVSSDTGVITTHIGSARRIQ